MVTGGNSQLANLDILEGTEMIHAGALRRRYFGALGLVTICVLAGCVNTEDQQRVRSSGLSTTSVTQGGDEGRTSWYPDQAALSPAVVSGPNFGRLFSTVIDGEVDAQPLVSQGTLLVVTETNHVYGLDPVSGTILWTKSLGTPVAASDVGCPDVSPSIGITGTPVIDQSTNTAYIFAKTYTNGISGAIAWSAHALDVATGNEKAGFPVAIAGNAANDSTQTFPARTQNQRAGLLLLNGVVYAAFGSQCDITPYAGWVAGVSTSGQLTTMWTTEAGPSRTDGAGIWQSGGGLVSDGTGQIIFETGNGGAVAGPIAGTNPPRVLAESVVRLTVQADGSLQAKDFFSPYDAVQLDTWDGDLGSGGPVALPAPYFGTTQYPRLLVVPGKEGYVYLLNRDNFGGIGNGPGGGDAVVNRSGTYGGFWTKPAIWPGDGGYIFLAAASGGNAGHPNNGGSFRVLKYGVDGNGVPALSLAGTSTDNFGYSSGQAVVTSDGTTSGSALVWIVWAPDGTGAGAQLRAYDPVPINGVPLVRYSSPIGTATKYAPPGINNGRVYVGTRDGHIMAYGSQATSPLVGSGVDLGYAIIGQSSQGTLSVHSASALTVTAVSSSSAEFVVGQPVPALPAALASGATFQVPITFTPSASGPRAGTVTITTSAGTAQFSVSGQGQTKDPNLTLTPPILSFGGLPVGGHAAQGLTMSNTGATALTINSVTVPGAPFTVTGAPAAGTALAPGQAVTINVSFDPTATGMFTGTIGLATSVGAKTVQLSGSCTTPGVMVISPLSIAFGSVAPGSTATASFTVTNAGGTSIQITKSKPPALGLFVAKTTLAEGTTIPAGTTVTEYVSFSPTAI